MVSVMAAPLDTSTPPERGLCLARSKLASSTITSTPERSSTSSRRNMTCSASSWRGSSKPTMCWSSSSITSTHPSASSVQRPSPERSTRVTGGDDSALEVISGGLGGPAPAAVEESWAREVTAAAITRRRATTGSQKMGCQDDHQRDQRPYERNPRPDHCCSFQRLRHLRELTLTTIRSSAWSTEGRVPFFISSTYHRAMNSG